MVPNGFFVDEQGILRYVKIGGFDVRKPEDAAAIEALLRQGATKRSDNSDTARKFRMVREALRQAEEEVKRDPQNMDKQLNLAERRVEARQYRAARWDFETALAREKSARALMGLAAACLDLGDRQRAAAALKEARELEPDNWIIRKQIWAIEHPEKFYPAIDTGWQKERIEQEDAARKKSSVPH